MSSSVKSQLPFLAFPVHHDPVVIVDNHTTNFGAIRIINHVNNIVIQLVNIDVKPHGPAPAPAVQHWSHLASPPHIPIDLIFQSN